MAWKQTAIIEYIKKIPEGQKVSVRHLASAMSVSKGTAYRAIQAAETMGLVKITPRSGTIRVGQTMRSGSAKERQTAGPDEDAETLASAIKRLGLTVLCPAANLDRPVNRIILGDGSVGQFRENVKFADENALCLVGDRPDILQEATALGIDVIATGGACVSDMQLLAAQNNGSCVLCTEQDSLLVYNLLMAECPDETAYVPGDSVRNWMRMPLYLYYNDMVADWHRLYRPVVSLFSKCAVVNNDLSICGTLDAVNALASTPSRKISSLYSTDEVGCFVVDEDTSMRSLADGMIKEGCATAYVTRGDTLCGMITSNDILKYYQYNKASGGLQPQNFTALEVVGRDSRAMRCTYAAKIPETTCGACENLFSVLVSAAHQHCEEKFKYKCALTSGTFYSLEYCHSCDLMVSSEILKSEPYGCMVEVEIYDDGAIYARCIFMVSLCGEAETEEGKNSRCLY